MTAMRRLPPFPELVAFEAVARHLSFTKAAEELCITQSAVSHRVRRLEQFLRVRLLHRSNPGLTLTSDGAALLPQLKSALDALEQLGRRRERRLRIAAASALCSCWLAGRLPRFMQQRPGVTLELVPMENDRTPIPEVDVRVLWVAPHEEPTVPTQLALATEQVFPVCSPSALRDLQDRSSAFAALPLIHKTSHMTGEWSWSTWLARLNLGAERRQRGELRLGDLGLTLSAAINGAGIALSRSLLAHDALSDGRVVVPLNGIEPMESTRRHVVRWRRDRLGDPDIESFALWLAEEASCSVEAVRHRIQSPSAPTSLQAVG
jgi:LysR family glycine cleavage system transcriptional activator